MLLWLAIFVVSLALLLVSSKFFTNAAEKIGNFLKFPSFVIGVFIIGIGTSLPELVASIIAVSKNTSEIVSGNILGANISNLLLIMGLLAVLSEKEVHLGSRYIFIDLHYLIGAALLLCIIMFDGQITYKEGIFCLVLFIIFSVYVIRSGETPASHKKELEEKRHVVFPVKQLVILAFGGIGIFFGADYTVQALTHIAEHFTISPAIVSLTLLSLGTTLPELAVNFTVIKEGKPEMAVGNILGSCIFNTLAIPGIVSMIGSIHVPDELLSFSLPLFAGCILLFYLVTQDKKISQWEGFIFLVLYLLFIGKTTGLV